MGVLCACFQGHCGTEAAVIATWLAVPLFGCPYTHVFAKPALIKLIHALRVWPHKIVREGTMVGRIAGGMTDGETECTEY